MVDLESVDGYPEKVSIPRNGDHFVYILRLFGDRWYIGETEAPKRRIVSHVRSRGLGSSWTKKHPPVGIASVLRFDSREEAKRREGEIARAFAHYYGSGKVGGGK